MYFSMKNTLKNYRNRTSKDPRNLVINHLLDLLLGSQLVIS